MKQTLIALPIYVAAKELPYKAQDYDDSQVTSNSLAAAVATFRTLRQNTLSNWCESWNTYNKAGEEKSDMGQAQQCYTLIDESDRKIAGLKEKIDTEKSNKETAAAAEAAAQEEKEKQANKEATTFALMAKNLKMCDKEKSRLTEEKNHYQEMKTRLQEAMTVVNDMMKNRRDQTTLRDDSGAKVNNFVQIKEMVSKMALTHGLKAPNPSPKGVESIIKQLQDKSDENLKQASKELKKTTTGCTKTHNSNVVKRDNAKQQKESQESIETQKRSDKNTANSNLESHLAEMKTEKKSLQDRQLYCGDTLDNYNFEHKTFAEKENALALIINILANPTDDKQTTPKVLSKPENVLQSATVNGTAGVQACTVEVPWKKPESFLQLKTSTNLLKMQQSSSFTKQGLIQDFEKLVNMNQDGAEYLTLLQTAQSATAPKVFRQLYDMINKMVKRLEQEANKAQKNDNDCTSNLQKEENKRDLALSNAKEASMGALGAFGNIHSEYQKELKLHQDFDDTRTDFISQKKTEAERFRQYTNQRQDNEATLSAARKALQVMAEMMHKNNKQVQKQNFDENNENIQGRSGATAGNMNEVGVGGGPYTVGINMLKKLVSETQHILSESKALNDKLAKGFYDFDVVTTEKLNQLNEFESQANKEVADETMEKTTAMTIMKSQMAILRSALDNFQQWSAKCSNNQMTWEEALQAREQEIQTLRKAKQKLCGDSALGLSDKPECKQIE